MNTETTDPVQPPDEKPSIQAVGSNGLLSETAHHLKTWPSYFAAVADGRKTFEARKADRDYRVGDTLVLKEWDPETHQYSGREVRRTITYILTGPGFGVEAGCCILALASDNSSISGETAVISPDPNRE